MAYEIIEDGYYNFNPISFTLPMVRKVQTPLIAKSLISIQPMSMPSGSIFYMDYLYGISFQEVKEKLEGAKDTAEVKQLFVSWIRKNYEKTIMEVVEKDFPQYMDQLRKLIVLK